MSIRNPHKIFKQAYIHNDVEGSLILLPMPPNYYSSDIFKVDIFRVMLPVMHPPIRWFSQWTSESYEKNVSQKFLED